MDWLANNFRSGASPNAAMMLTKSFGELDRLSKDFAAFLQYAGGTAGVFEVAVWTHFNLVARVDQLSNWLPKIKKLMV